MILVNDLLKENGNFYNVTEFNQIFNVNANFLIYKGIERAIKDMGKKYNVVKFSKKLSYPIIPFNINKLITTAKGSKHIYNILNIKTHEPTSKSKWKEKLNITDEKWKHIYQYPFQKHISKTLQWFQTRINHRIIATRKFLYTIKIKESSHCLYCNAEETITHMLWACPITQDIINSLKGWLFNNENLEITAETFIFNINKNFTSAQLYILLETKYYIFSAKHLNKQLSIINLKNRLKRVLQTFDIIASENNREDSFMHSWDPYRAKILH